MDPKVKSTRVANGASSRGRADSALKTNPARFPLLTSAAFDKINYRRQFLIEDLLVNRQVCVLGGPKKSLKTSVICDMAISLATGTRCLGHFPVPRAKRVAVFSGETSPGDLQDLARRVCAARKLRLEQADQVLWVHNLPMLSKKHDLAALTGFLRDTEIDVAFVDPLFLCLLDLASSSLATNLYAIGPVLRAAAQACLEVGTTPVFAHHSTKGANKSNRSHQRTSKRGSQSIVPLDLDDLAFAGVAEFARQWILLGRSEPYVPGTGRHRLTMTAGGSAGHSGCWHVEVDEGTADSELKGRRWRPRVRSLSNDSQDSDL
ncbi:MAG TPA: AAA family ATPase [Planctomycetaceae bacterium]|nr:AAA family ATPase [Planctomycetaceae bacterium]